MTDRTDPMGGRRRWQTAGDGLWHKLAPEARRMRSKPTAAEELLWKRLRKQALGVRFRRQQVVDRFIVDFCCLEARLIVEVDGPVHERQSERDAERDAVLRGSGFRMLRIANDDVENRIEMVVAAIREALQSVVPASGAAT